jgi:multidrug transporter EmrE-like cation transporter
MKDFIDTWISQYNWKVGKISTLPILFGFTMALLDVIMVFTSKYVSIGTIPYNTGLIFATLIYSLQPYLFLKALKFENMIVTNLIWNLLSDIIVTIAGVFIFNESIKGIRWLAILMSIFSVLLLAYTDT